MTALFQSFLRFVNNMDARAVTSALVTIALFTFLVVMMVFGKDELGLDKAAVQDTIDRISDSPLALIGVIAVYCALALTGFPQTFLIAGTVAVFGAQQGAGYAWIATMISASFTFLLGHVFGARAVRRLSAGRAATMIDVVRRHGVVASMMVRWTPSAPFVVINAICGAAHIRLWKFWLGTGIGILPKILFIALFTDQIGELSSAFSQRDLRNLAVIAGILCAWLAFLLLVRHLYMRMRRTTLAGLSDEAAGLNPK
ncbi:TVP38/TMEM64 family protein [Parvularcula oceani]|uniref:TVP38/TMEM64 family protein n=1 Tax=Parvularcula oceani TaxID=1247963 RepID=UPI0004E1AFF5|nr:VTT domain-containing protein [Parvularcula oceani]